jgi:apolipoprotein N-acyltransferase
MNVWSYLAWFCLIPLFVALAQTDRSHLFKSGALFGAVFGLVAYYWMPGAVTAFVGGSSIYGWLFYLLSVVICSLYFGGLTFLYSKLKRANNIPWFNALLVAVIWTLGEQFLSFCFEGMPWFGFQVGDLLVGEQYFIQPAELGGVFLLSFVVVFISAWIGFVVSMRSWKLIWMPGVTLGAYFGLCFFLYQRLDMVKHKPAKEVTIAIMCENTAPEEKWNNKNGAFMVKKLLSLNKQAADLKPDIVLWTESAVPWTYKPDDDFVKEVVKISAANNVTQIMGINSDYDKKAVYNSAYCILPDGTVAGRYDKRFLLSLAEKPLPFFSLPFLSTDGFYAIAGENATPLPTPKGKAGVLICNEALISRSAIDMVRNGAGFLVNISNDGWFSNVPFLVRNHFNNARLRAVEVRRDIAVNSNLGISGSISADGSIVSANQGSQSFVGKVTLEEGSCKTLIVQYPYWFLSALIVSFILLIGLNFFIPSLK